MIMLKFIKQKGIWMFPPQWMLLYIQKWFQVTLNTIISAVKGTKSKTYSSKIILIFPGNFLILFVNQSTLAIYSPSLVTTFLEKNCVYFNVISKFTSMHTSNIFKRTEQIKEIQKQLPFSKSILLPQTLLHATKY